MRRRASTPTRAAGCSFREPFSPAARSPTDGAWSGAATAALGAAGIATQIVESSAGEGEDAVSDTGGSRGAPTTWVAPWPTDRPVGPTYLLDLLVGGEMSGAEVVNYDPGEPFRFVPTATDAAIVRRSALADAGLTGSPDAAIAAAIRAPAASGWRHLSVGAETRP